MAIIKNKITVLEADTDGAVINLTHEKIRFEAPEKMKISEILQLYGGFFYLQKLKQAFTKAYAVCYNYFIVFE